MSHLSRPSEPAASRSTPSTRIGSRLPQPAPNPEEPLVIVDIDEYDENDDGAVDVVIILSLGEEGSEYQKTGTAFMTRVPADLVVRRDSVVQAAELIQALEDKARQLKEQAEADEQAEQQEEQSAQADEQQAAQAVAPPPFMPPTEAQQPGAPPTVPQQPMAAAAQGAFDGQDGRV